MSGHMVLTVVSLLLMLMMAVSACYQIGAVVQESADFWTCYYLLVPNWLTHKQFEVWMNQEVPLDNKQVTRKEAFDTSPEYAEQQIKTISEVLTSPAPYEVYEIVTV